MYVEVSEGAYRVHTECLSGESFKGEAIRLGRLGKKIAESCVEPHNSISQLT